VKGTGCLFEPVIPAISLYASLIAGSNPRRRKGPKGDDSLATDFTVCTVSSSIAEMSIPSQWTM